MYVTWLWFIRDIATFYNYKIPFACFPWKDPDAVEYTIPIIKALNGLPVYYRYHIKNGLELALGKGLKIVRHQDFTEKRNQSQKRKENERKEIKD